MPTKTFDFRLEQKETPPEFDFRLDDVSLRNDPNDAYFGLTDPDEETKRFKQSIDIADINELSISEVEDNWDIFDPSEAPEPEPTEYAMPSTIKLTEEQVGRIAKEFEQKRWEEEPTIQAIKGYFDIDKEALLRRLETFPDPDEPRDFQDMREEYTYKQKARAINDDDLDRIIKTSINNPDRIPEDLRNVLFDEQKIREAIKTIKSLPNSGQSAFIILQRRSNLFNIPSYLSRKGIEKIWGLYGKETYIAIEAAERILQEKNQKDAFNWTRILDLPAAIGQTILEFAAVPDITSKIAAFSKLPVAAQSIISTSTKFAMREILTLPTEEETITGKVGKIATSTGIGAALGGAGKYIPNPFIRIPAVTGGFMGLTAMQGGSGDEILEAGVTILGFEALGIINKASVSVRTKLGRLRIARAIKSARKHNPDLKGVPDESIGFVLKEFKEISFWQRELKKNRVTQDIATMRINESLNKIRPVARAIQREAVVTPTVGKKQFVSVQQAIETKLKVSTKAAKRAVEIATTEGVTKADQYLSAVKAVGEKAAEKVIAETKPAPTEAIAAPEEPVAPITPEKAVEVEKEIKDVKKEAITEPTPSPEVEPRKAGKFIPTGKLDPTDAKEALEIIRLHKGGVSVGGIFETKWDEEYIDMEGRKGGYVVTSVEYSSEQVDIAYRTIQKPVESLMPDTDLFAMPGKEAQMKAIAQKMAKVKGVVKPKKKGPKPLTKPTALPLPKAKTSQEDYIKAVYQATGKEKDEARYAISGVKVEGDTIVATDGRRMFWAKGKWGKDGVYINPASLKKGELGKPSKQKFPLWRDIVPDVSDQKPILVPSGGVYEDLDTVFRRVRQAASMTTEMSRGITIIENKDGSLGFAVAAPEIGHVEINIQIGGKILGAVNPQFFMDAIKYHAIRGDRAFEFYFSDPTRPILTKSLDGKTSTLTMPINVGEPSEAITKAISEGKLPEGVKPTGKGKAGFPGKAVGGEMPKALEPTARKPVTAEKIITSLSKALKVPYASMATHRPRAAAGWYEIKPRGIRQIDVRDLDTASHEVGHHIDHYYKIRQAGISRAGQKTYKMPEGTAKGTAAELLRLGKMLYGTRKPPGGYKSEGIAEYIRGYLTGHLNVEKEAPKFHKWFIEDYLPNNPEVATGLENARSLLTDYRLQGAEARIESQINTKEIKGSLGDRASAANLWFQQMFVDEFAPLRKGIEEAGIERKELKPTDDPYELAVYFTQKEGARARQMVLFGTIDLWGNKTGKGLKEIMKPIADENAVRPFTHFVVAARSLDLWKRSINPGISKEDAQYVYNLYKDNEGWQEIAKEITEWNHRVLNYLVQAGALPKETADNMIKANPIYVPFLRAFAKGEKRFGGGGAGAGLITTKKGVFAIKGSGREIIDPFESMITQTRRMIAIAHKSVIARSLANLEAKHRGLAGLIWKVPAPKKATTFRAEQAIKQLQKMGVEVTGEGLPEPGEMMEGKPEVYDALMTIYGNSPIYLGKDNIIAIVQNGKKTWYEVSPEMYKLLQGLDKFYLPRFIDVIFGKPGRAMRLGATGLNASFGLVRNPIRDMQDTIFKGTHARGPGATVKGVAKDLSRLGLAKSMGIEPSKAAEAFVAQGGQISGFIGQDRRSLQHLKGEMLASSIGRYSIHTVKHPIDAMREVFGVAETGPRIQEYEKALEFAEKKYGKGSPDAKVYAFNKAQDQTINYSRHGIIGKWLNQMIPFWNANAQDISKVSRTFRKRGKEATAYAVAFLTLPALGLWWYNKDEEWYKELPAFEKANYLHVKIPGKDSIIRIPVPFLVGHIFQGFPVTIVDALYNADKTRVTEFFKKVLEADVYSLAEWPAIVSPVIDVLQNKDWAGRPIVPRSVEEKLPSDQYKEYTTQFAKDIGEIFEMSPAQIEHLMNSYSGGLYRRVTSTAELAAGRREKELAAVDIPIVGKLFVRDPYAPKASIERFYKRKELLEAKFQSKKITAEEIGERAVYNAIGNVLTELWKLLREEKTIDGRKGLYKKINDLIKNTKSIKRPDKK